MTTPTGTRTRLRHFTIHCTNVNSRNGYRRRCPGSKVRTHPFGETPYNSAARCPKCEHVEDLEPYRNGYRFAEHVKRDDTLELSLDRSSTGAALRDVARAIEREFGGQARQVQISLVRSDA